MNGKFNKKISWKAGKREILAEGHTKILVNQWFINPRTKEQIEFTLFSKTKDNWPTIVMAITDKLEVITVQQFRHGADEITLEVPGGNPDHKFKDNSPITVGRRELSEETGYTPRKIIQLAPYSFFDPSAYEIGYYPCLALGCYPTPEKKENKSSEQIKIQLIPLDKYLKRIFRGEIPDSKSGHLLIMSLPYILSTNAETLTRKLLA